MVSIGGITCSIRIDVVSLGSLRLVTDATVHSKLVPLGIHLASA